MKSILYVALGGSIGSVLRYLASILLKNYTSLFFPLNTFLVNAVGCFVIGLAYALISNNLNFSNVKPFLIVGILGGFTTYSAYAFEVVEMLKNQLFKQAVLYILCSNVICILFAYLGYSIKK